MRNTTFKNRVPLVHLLRGRDNNFHLLRILAAFCVLLSHSFALATGNASDEPLRSLLGMSLGAVSVDVFFVSSGFLVGGSLFSNNSALRFLISRLLRIYPALLVVTVLTVFVLGPILTAYSFADYFGFRDTWLYLAKNTIVAFGVSHTLPGVFLDNPYRAAVNGSLWTLPYEIWMYCILFGGWLIARRCGANSLTLKLVTCSVLTTSLMLLLATRVGAFNLNAAFLRLFFLFFAGFSLWLFKERVILGFAPVLLCVTALGTAWLFNEIAFFAAYCITFPLLVLNFAFVPEGTIRKFNRVGDYSYGAYLFAFPVQQTLAMLVPGIGAVAMTAAASLVTLCLAIVSWHFIESPAMYRRESAEQFIRMLLKGKWSSRDRDRVKRI